MSCIYFELHAYVYCTVLGHLILLVHHVTCATFVVSCAAEQVWNHFDAQECEGSPIGVRVRLDNGVTGFIPLRELSDDDVKDPSERVRSNMTIHARITRIDITRFSVNLSSKSSDLRDSGKWG